MWNSGNPYDNSTNENVDASKNPLISDDKIFNPYQNNDNNKQNNDFNPYQDSYNDQPNLNDDNFSNPYGNDNNNNNNNNNDLSNPFGNDNKTQNFNNNNNNKDFSNPYGNDNNNNNNDLSNPFGNDNNNQNFNNNNNNNNDLSNPFGNDNNNQNFNNNNNNNNDFSNPFGNDFKNNDNNGDNSNNNFNNNNNFKDDFSNPFKDNNDNNNNNMFNPYNDNPFEKNNFDNNQNNNNNQFSNFQNNNESSAFNPYSMNNNNSNFNNFNNSNFNNNNFNNGNNSDVNYKNELRIQNKIIASDDTSNEKDYKKIKAIIEKCEMLLNTSKNEYDSFNIKEAITTLCKSIKALDGLKQTINNQKKVFVAFLPQINTLRSKSFSNLQEYRIMVYKLIPIRFKPVLFRPYENNEQLIDFCSKYILNKPFISFDDYYEPSSIEENKKAKNVIYNNFNQGQRAGKKCFLLFGPKGCGKTLLLHAMANHLGARIAQIEGLELFKIPYFSREFVKACFGNMQFKPLIIYIKDMEKMIPNLNNFNFIYDKAASSFKANVYFVASTSVSVYQLPKAINSKFQFYQCITPVDNNHKSEYIRFISDKIGIKINMSDKDLNDFSIYNLSNFSNEDIFDLIRNSIDVKKQRTPPEEENWVYKEGLNYDDLMNCLGTVNQSLTPDVKKAYYL